MRKKNTLRFRACLLLYETKIRWFTHFHKISPDSLCMFTLKVHEATPPRRVEAGGAVCSETQNNNKCSNDQIHTLIKNPHLIFVHLLCPSISEFVPVGGLIGLKSRASMGWEGCRTSWRGGAKGRRGGERHVFICRKKKKKQTKCSLNLGLLITMMMSVYVFFQIKFGSF